MSHTPESIAIELKRIHNLVPQSLRDKAVITVKKTPTMEFLAKKFLEESTDEEAKKQTKILLDSGEFSKEVIRENTQVTKIIDDIINREIKKSIKAGRLPKDATPYAHIKPNEEI